jgi:hypothetical protein
MVSTFYNLKNGTKMSHTDVFSCCPPVLGSSLPLGPLCPLSCLLSLRCAPPPPPYTNYHNFFSSVNNYITLNGLLIDTVETQAPKQLPALPVYPPRLCYQFMLYMRTCLMT